MKIIYLIFDVNGKPSSVSLKKPRINPNTNRMSVLKKGETFQPIKLKSGQSIHEWSQ